MAAADVVISGTVLTVDDAQPTVDGSDRTVEPDRRHPAGDHARRRPRPDAILDGSPWIGNIDLPPEQIADPEVRATFWPAARSTADDPGA